MYGGGKKWPPHTTCTKTYGQNSAVDVVKSFHEPYVYYLLAVFTSATKLHGIPFK